MKNYMTELTDALISDQELRRAWQANIAMAYMDSYAWYKMETGKKVMNKEDRHTIANNAADHFLKLLCDDNNY